MKNRVKKLSILGVSALAVLALGVGALNMEETSAANEPNTFAMDGASVRLEEPYGLRFTTQVYNDYLDGLETKKTNGEITSYSFGTLITANHLIAGKGGSLSKANLNDADVNNVVRTKWGEKVSEDYSEYHAVVKEIPETEYDLDLYAVSYVEIDGEYTFSDPMVRSVAFVAATLIKGGEENTVLQDYIDKACDSLTFDKSEMAMVVGQEDTLVATSNLENYPIIWNSTDKSVVTVDDNGKVTAVGEGQAQVTATLGDQTATCTYTVNQLTTEAVVYSGPKSTGNVEWYVKGNVSAVKIENNNGGTDSIAFTQDGNKITIAEAAFADTAFVKWSAESAYLNGTGAKPKYEGQKDITVETDNGTQTIKAEIIYPVITFVDGKLPSIIKASGCTVSVETITYSSNQTYALKVVVPAKTSAKLQFSAEWVQMAIANQKDGMQYLRANVPALGTISGWTSWTNTNASENEVDGANESTGTRQRKIFNISTVQSQIADGADYCSIVFKNTSWTAESTIYFNLIGTNNNWN